VSDLKVGDRVHVEVPPRRKFSGVIVGEGREKFWWNVIKDGTKSSAAYHKSFCRPEADAAVSTTGEPNG
jgi:hypothetical protein